MHINHSLRQYAAREKNLHLSGLTETSQIRTSLRTEKLEGEKPNVDNINGALSLDPAIVVAPIFFLTMAAIVFIQKLSYQLYSQKILYKTSCERCRFFSNNKYLKCAVNPSIVLTKEAINCPDYCSQDKQSFQFSKLNNYKKN